MWTGATALFAWTLRMDARYVYPHMVRASVALIVLFLLSMAAIDAFGTSRTGLIFFELVCQMNVVLTAAAGVSYFVTAVSEEKDAGTFALLQLAGVTPLAITLGKSTSRLVSSLMLMVSQVPFTFLAVTLGGIRWQQVLAAWLCLAAWMILVANMALLCSARSTTSGRAAAAAGIVLVIWFGMPSVLRTTLAAVPVIWISAGVRGTLLGLCNLMELVSPWIQLDELLNRWEDATVLGGQFWSSLLVACVCFSVSTLRLTAWTRPTEDGVSGEVDRGVRRRWPVSRCWRLPLAWRDFHFFAGGRSFFAARWIGWLLVYGMFVGVQRMELGRWQATFSGEYGWQLVLLLCGALSVECLLLATGSLHSEVRQMTQSSLAMLPFSPTRIFLEKAAGCGLSVLPTASWVGIAALLTGERLWIYLEWDAVLAWLLMLMFSTHVAALTSLYTRWAALPITLMVSFVAFFVIAGPMLLIPSTVGTLTRTHNIESSLLLAWAITIFWTWVLLVLPLQLWIRERWLIAVRT